MLAPEPAIRLPLPASIEVLPRQIPAREQLATLLPAGTRVYLTDLGGSDTDAEMLVAARRLTDIGCKAVPHLAARRMASRQALERRVGRLAEEAGVDDLLVVGGGVPTPVGPYGSAMEILETGTLHRYGIKDIAVAGHPEGSPDIPDATAMDALRQKQALAQEAGLRLRIVTQFGFDPLRTLAWIDNLARIGIDIPVHVGVAGPAKLTTLTRYAALCGVGNSLSMLKRGAGSFWSLTTGYSPEAFVLPLEEQLAALARPAISQMHIFPFGGLETASNWLRQRGSWPLRQHAQ
ncbi:SAM-dependent methyltransferase [Devosia sp.]|uniref:SAM-dependent methyltransferase n=1 Tax=Devosia sp. TaxID=1871048 RepID=UPI001AC5845F|nr:SAM-dependent methyltransferase [Devosia sp.]MBN9333169.1 SAM-dependent methyltransferase [Devosia sp.]